MPSGEIAKSFMEIDGTVEEIFIAKIVENEDKLFVGKAIKKVVFDMKTPNIFYITYKNLLSIPSIPYKLANFTEDRKSLLGINDSNQNDMLSPLQTRNNSRVEIKFSQHLNKIPLRIMKNDYSMPLLPFLPQPFVIDKKKYKIPSLRNVFFDSYKFPVIDPKSEYMAISDKNYNQSLSDRKGRKIKFVTSHSSCV